MDNQEAISVLELINARTDYFLINDYARAKAIDMAISALQAQDSKTRKICDTCKHDPPSKKWPCVDCDMREPADRWEPKGEQVAKILADILDGCPLVDPCNKIWSLEGWCKDHCKPGQQEPDSECWLKYAEIMVEETENSNKSSLTQKGLDTIQSQDVPVINAGDMVSRRAAIDALMDEFKRVPTTAIRAKNRIDRLPSAQPEIIRCKDCTYGVQDEYGRWYCRSLGCQIGDEDGNGFCSDAERRTDEGSD